MSATASPTNAELPPSVVVSELLDAIDATAQPPAAAVAAPPKAAFGHRPSPPVAAVQAPLRSVAGPAGELRAPSQYTGCTRSLASRGDRAAVRYPHRCRRRRWQTLTLESLLDFYKNPTRWFLRQRLQLYLPFEEEPPDDREPIDLSFLQKWDVGDRPPDRPARRRRRAEPRDRVARQRHPARTAHPGQADGGSTDGGRRPDPRGRRHARHRDEPSIPALST
jgi:exodeoxyribonuclease V gamma subunit